MLLDGNSSCWSINNCIDLFDPLLHFTTIWSQPVVASLGIKVSLRVVKHQSLPGIWGFRWLMWLSTRVFTNFLRCNLTTICKKPCISTSISRYMVRPGLPYFGVFSTMPWGLKTRSPRKSTEMRWSLDSSLRCFPPCVHTDSLCVQAWWQQIMKWICTTSVTASSTIFIKFHAFHFDLTFQF